jgi:hypothetical protein
LILLCCNPSPNNKHGWRRGCSGKPYWGVRPAEAGYPGDDVKVCDGMWIFLWSPCLYPSTLGKLPLHAFRVYYKPLLSRLISGRAFIRKQNHLVFRSALLLADHGARSKAKSWQALVRVASIGLFVSKTSPTNLRHPVTTSVVRGQSQPVWR